MNNCKICQQQQKTSKTIFRCRFSWGQCSGVNFHGGGGAIFLWGVRGLFSWGYFSGHLKKLFLTFLQNSQETTSDRVPFFNCRLGSFNNSFFNSTMYVHFFKGKAFITNARLKWQKIKLKLSDTLKLKLQKFKIICFLHPRSHQKIAEDILKSVQKTSMSVLTTLYD